jgi:DNA-binding beta-propeller fold protein YncE
MLVPGTRFAVVSDAGLHDNAVYSVDLDAVARGDPALISTMVFPAPQMIDFGLAFVSPNHVYASGGANGVIYAFTIDAMGKLARDATSDIEMGPSNAGRPKWYVGGIAVSSDEKKLLVAPAAYDTDLRSVDLSSKTVTPMVTRLPASFTFELVRDPQDPNGSTHWLTLMGSAQLLQIDAKSQQIVQKLTVGKNPEGIAVLDAAHVVVASSDEDTLVVFDAAGKTVQTLALRSDGLTGSQPSTLAYDPARKRLYAALSGINAIGVFDVDTSAQAPLTPVGEIPTAWWPTSVKLRPDGSIVVITGKGHGTGPGTRMTGLGEDGETASNTRGSIAVIAPPDAMTLQSMSAIVRASRLATEAQGFPTVTCPGQSYDFPIPLKNDTPSSVIKKVVYIVRENKTYDAVFGDLPGTNGDPSLVMAPGRMDDIWVNARLIARAFANFDNFYVQAEQSLQGHVWTTFGRSSDFIERTWSPTWGRAVRLPIAGIDRDVGSPLGGSLFLWAERNKIPYENFGEIVGVGDQGLDSRYPGLVYSMTTPDLEKACYIAARSRALCDLRDLTYVVLPNDHTAGLAPGRPAPEVFLAVNDAATGMIVDAISHSPMWPQTLVIVTEDDPQDGGDHVDGHRTLLFMASPWVKRGFVSHTKTDMAAIHKLLAHVFAKPYPSESVANAAIPYDAFTSTPDYTPYTYTPMKTKLVCNPQMDITGMSDDWDFSQPDNQPGLSEQVMRHMREISGQK